MTEALPSAYTYGRVVARFLRAVGDGTDVDTLPEAEPATGKVTFRPIEVDRIVPDTTAAPTPIITHNPIECMLDGGGYLSRNGMPGVWLWTGQWSVVLDVAGLARTGWTIEVTTAHTDLAPLDLWQSQPYVPPTGVTVTTMLVPANPVDGHGLIWSAAAGGLAWGPVGGALTPITASTTTTAGTSVGQLVGYLNTAAAPVTVDGVTLPAGQAVVLMWDGTEWVQPSMLGGTAPAVTDTEGPVWDATLTTGTPTDTSVVIAASALATDNMAVTGYRYRLTGESAEIARTIVPSGLNFTLSGLTASTGYTAPILWAIDAAGNKSAELTAQAFITATPPPSWKTVFYDTFTGAASTDLLAHTPDIGAAWTYTKPAGTNKIIINAAGQAQAQWADTNYSAPRGKILTDNADLKLRITLDYVLTSATANCHVSGVAFDNSATSLTAGAYVDGTGAIHLDGHVLTATETSGLTSLAPLSGTMVITLDGTGTIAADGTSNVSITLEIDGALYRRWTNVDWNGTGSVATGQYIAGAQVSFGGGNVHAGSPLGSTLVDNVRIEKWA